MMRSLTWKMIGVRPLAILTLALGGAACTTPAPLNAADVHDSVIVLDAHADVVLPDTSPLYLGADGRSKAALDKLAAGGVDAVVMALATGPKPRTSEGRAAGAAEVSAKLEAVQALLAAHPAELALATSST